MLKQPFTQAGFEALQTSLYVLDDVALQLEADAIGADFVLWMDLHFELSAEQLLFLAEIDPQMLQFLSNQTAFAVAHRLVINLQKAPVAARGDKTGKVIKTESNFTASNGVALPMDVDGELLIKIDYID